MREWPPRTHARSSACSSSCGPTATSLIVSTLLAILSQAAAIAVIVLTGLVINELRGGQDGHELALPDRLDPRRRAAAGGADARPQVHLRQAGARGRVGHARRALRAPAPPLVRVLRPAPDRAADVARDRRPADDPVLPRLRADLLRPARDHDRLRHGRPLLLRLAAGADRPRDHAVPRRRRLPLQPGLAPRPARRAAEARRRRDRVGGVDRRRPHRQVVRAGGSGRAAVPGGDATASSR